MISPVGSELLQELLQEIGRSGDKLADVELAGFLAKRGAAYVGELMWIGRALNGWEPIGAPRQFVSSHNVDETMKNFGSADRESCPLRWVTKQWGQENCYKENFYNTKRSAFWRTAKRTLLAPGEIDELWSSRLVWSNLYKIAPFDGGNPNSKLQNIQYPFCRDILVQEIVAFRPRRVVFATGIDWVERFLDNSLFVRTDSKTFGQYVLGVGDLILNDEKIGEFVIAPHPQGKDEDRWVEEVRAALRVDPTVGS
jgi:hypothetical protein